MMTAKIQENQLFTLLEFYWDKYENAEFIAKDPIRIPHQFTLRQDIEISGLFASILAWGRRPGIIKSAGSLMQRMEFEPFAFITQSTESDHKKLLGFVHRTFNDTDLLFFCNALRHYYRESDSLEDIFYHALRKGDGIYGGLTALHHNFFRHDWAPAKSAKHLSNPAKGSACKRLNMFLRWMVRSAERGVDFGIWNRISPADLICPLDVHVMNTAHKLGLIEGGKSNWENAFRLTSILKSMDPNDPVKYDYALFGISIGGETIPI